MCHRTREWQMKINGPNRSWYVRFDAQLMRAHIVHSNMIAFRAQIEEFKTWSEGREDFICSLHSRENQRECESDRERGLKGSELEMEEMDLKRLEVQA